MYIYTYANKPKGMNISTNEDFCHETMQHRKELWEEVKGLRSEGHSLFKFKL